LAELPTGSVELYAVLVRGPSVTRTTTLEFNPLGNTTSTASTEIWLRTGSPDAKYVAVSVHPTTGLAAIGAMTGTGPSLPSLSSSPPVAPSGS
jgi:hypothetical protein